MTLDRYTAQRILVLEDTNRALQHRIAQLTYELQEARKACPTPNCPLASTGKLSSLLTESKSPSA